MSIEEEKYNKLRESLRSLPRIRAKSGFEARLHRKIREHESLTGLQQPLKEKSSFFDILANLFKPSLVPAVGLTIVLLAVVVVYFAYFNELKKDNQPSQEYSSGEKKGEFVIYVKKDGDRVYDETARDITSADVDLSTSTGEYIPSTDVGTDKLSTPEIQPTPESERRAKDDRISDEQKIMMEKESEHRKESDDVKSQPKNDDGVIMKKGYIDKKEAPLNTREKKEDTSGKENEQFFDQKVYPNEEIKQDTEKSNKTEDTNRISRSTKDSLKAKDKNIEEQKDSIEK